MFNTILRRTAMLALASAGLAAIASANEPPSAAQTAVVADIKPGMQMTKVIELLGRAADSTENVGVGCGFIDVSRWRGLPVKVISIGGQVNSIVPTGDAKATEEVGAK